MSDPYDRLFTARIAPCTADAREAIRNGINITDDDGQRWTESIRQSSLINPARRRVPVLLSHDEKKPVGEIEGMFSDGGWWYLDFTLDPSKTFSCVAADNLRVGSPVSVGYRTLRHNESLAKVGVKQHTVAILSELSILRHGEQPAYPGAEVRFILRHKRIPRTAKSSPAEPPAWATPSQAPEPEGEVIYGGNAVLTRRNVGGWERLVSVEVRTGQSWFSAVRFPSLASEAGESLGSDELNEQVRERASEELVRLEGAVNVATSRRAA